MTPVVDVSHEAARGALRAVKGVALFGLLRTWHRIWPTPGMLLLVPMVEVGLSGPWSEDLRVANISTLEQLVLWPFGLLLASLGKTAPVAFLDPSAAAVPQGRAALLALGALGVGGIAGGGYGPLCLAAVLLLLWTARRAPSRP